MCFNILQSSQIETFSPGYLIFATTGKYKYLYFCYIKECGSIFAMIWGGTFLLPTVYNLKFSILAYTMAITKLFTNVF